MELKRFYGQKTGNAIVLTGREYVHCVKVTRHKTGYLIIGCIGDGYDYYAKIVLITPEEVIAEIERAELNVAEPKEELTLIQGCCKEFDFILQKAVELGATRIIPFESARSNSKPLGADRAESIVLDASKQCGRATLAEVTEPQPDLQSALELANNSKIKLMCYEGENNIRIADVVNESGSVAVVIGPEGGFTPEEVAVAERTGYTVVTLGKRILRAETASLVALTLIEREEGEL